MRWQNIFITCYGFVQQRNCFLFNLVKSELAANTRNAKWIVWETARRCKTNISFCSRLAVSTHRIRVVTKSIIKPCRSLWKHLALKGKQSKNGKYHSSLKLSVFFGIHICPYADWIFRLFYVPFLHICLHLFSSNNSSMCLRTSKRTGKALIIAELRQKYY